jgi:quercetin dioxygenase-like cupin family protein
MRKRLLVAVLVVPLCAPAAAPISVTELVSTTTTNTGQPLTVTANPKLTFSKYTIAPGAALPVHKHPFARYAYVLAGEIDVTLPDRNKTFHYKTGDTIVEAIDEWHFGANHGTVPTELLVIDQIPQDAKNNTVLKDAAR